MKTVSIVLGSSAEHVDDFTQSVAFTDEAVAKAYADIHSDDGGRDWKVITIPLDAITKAEIKVYEEIQNAGININHLAEVLTDKRIAPLIKQINDELKQVKP